MNIPTGQKLNVTRAQIVHWIEEVVAHQNNQKQSKDRAHFCQIWHEPLRHGKPASAAHLETLSQDSFYNSLIQNQQATDLSFM